MSVAVGATARAPPAAFDAAAGGGLGNKRRITSKKIVATVGSLTTEQQDDDAKVHIAELVEEFKLDADLLSACRVLSAKKRRMSAEETLKRGSRSLETVPEKYRKQALAKICGVDIAIFNNLTSEDTLTLFVWALGGAPKYRLPKLCMSIKEFYEWANDMHQQCGNLLRKRDWGDEFCDLDWQLGTYGFHLPVDDGCGYDVAITHVVKHSDETYAELPSTFKVTLQEVGEKYKITKNFSESSAMIVNSENGFSMPVLSLFKTAPQMN